MPASFAFPATVPGDNVVPIDLWIPMRPTGDLEDRGSHNFWTIARLKPRRQPRARPRRDAHDRGPPGTRVSGDKPRLRRHGEAAPGTRGRRGSARAAVAARRGRVHPAAHVRQHRHAPPVARGSAAARGGDAAGARRQPGTACSPDARREPAACAFGGAAAGLAVAYAGTRVLVSLAPATIPRLEQTSVDGQVLAFMALIATAVGLLFGLAPAVLGSSVNVTHALRDGGTRATGGAAGRRVRHTLVAAQLALAVVLLVGAGLLVRSFMRVAGLDLGFRAPQVLTAMVNLSPARYADAERQIAFTDEVLRRVQALPGVQAAGVSHSIPLTGINDQGGFTVEGRPDPPPGTQGPHANRPHVSPGYFDAMGIRLARRSPVRRAGSTGHGSGRDRQRRRGPDVLVRARARSGGGSPSSGQTAGPSGARSSAWSRAPAISGPRRHRRRRSTCPWRRRPCRT